jgi:hypothetical protein
VTRMLFVVVIALAQHNWTSVHAADVSAEGKAAVEAAITELGCSLDMGDEIEAKGDGYKAEYVLCADGPYYLSTCSKVLITGKTNPGPNRRARKASAPIRQLTRGSITRFPSASICFLHTWA